MRAPKAALIAIAASRLVMRVMALLPAVPPALRPVRGKSRRTERHSPAAPPRPALPSASPASSNPRRITWRGFPIMATYNLLLLPGDGIGPEVMAEVKKIIAWLNAHGMGTFETEEGLVGGACYDAHGVSVQDETVAKAKAADAVIFGAVGGPKWDKVPYEVRPEAGLLRLRKDPRRFGEVRPAVR